MTVRPTEHNRSTIVHGLTDTSRHVWHLVPSSIRTAVHDSSVVNSHRLRRLVWNCIPLTTHAMRRYQQDKLTFDKPAIISFPKSGRTYLVNTIEYYMGNTAVPTGNLVRGLYIEDLASAW